MHHGSKSQKDLLPPYFKLERFFAKYEFTVKHLLCCSDAEAVKMSDLLDKADDESKDMWEHLSLSYTESCGHPLLRKEIAKMYSAITEDDVLTVVPQEGIYISMKAFLDTFVKSEKHPTTKPHVIVTYPGYQSLYGNLESDGAHVTYWNAQYDTDTGWYFDIKHLLSSIEKNTQLLVVNFPHNPTGWVPSLQQWNEVINICRENNIMLFSDEIYRLSNNDNSEALPSACSLYENAVVLSGLSKIFALPGLRVGWLCTQNKQLMLSFQRFKDWLTICMSSPSEILAIIALRNQQWLLDHTMEIIHSNLKEMDTFFHKHSEFFEWHRPPASTISFVKVKPKLLESADGSVLTWCERLAQDVGLLLLPSTVYDFGDSFVRMGFGRKDIKVALSVLEQYIAK